jgi:hypothetical protein
MYVCMYASFVRGIFKYAVNHPVYVLTAQSPSLLYDVLNDTSANGFNGLYSKQVLVQSFDYGEKCT